MKFKNLSLIRWLAGGTFLVGLANSGLFYFNGKPRTAVVGALCLLFGIGYLIALGIHTDSE
jgi:hypothetical protein